MDGQEANGGGGTSTSIALNINIPAADSGGRRSHKNTSGLPEVEGKKNNTIFYPLLSLFCNTKHVDLPPQPKPLQRIVLTMIAFLHQQRSTTLHPCCTRASLPLSGAITELRRTRSFLSPLIGAIDASSSQKFGGSTSGLPDAVKAPSSHPISICMEMGWGVGGSSLC